MSEVPVVPHVKEESSPKKFEQKLGVKKGARKKAAKKPVTKKPQRKVGESSAKKALAKKIAARRQRKPFPYARVLAMWKAGKSSMAIAKSVGRYDSRAADPMHSFRVTLTRFHKGVRIDGKLVRLPHRVSRKALKLATKAGKKAAA
jgi:hypothetical protein